MVIDTRAQGAHGARLSALFPAAVRHVPHSLATPGTMARLLVLAKRLPLTGGGGLECHLGDPERVDLALRILPSAGEHRLLMEPAPASTESLPERARGDAWRGIHDFAGLWNRPGSIVERNVRCLWLEFDGAAARFVPDVFFDVGEGRFKVGYDWICGAARTLRRRAVPPAVAATFARLCRALPAGTHIGYVGCMLGRSADPMRATIRGLTARTIPPFLDSLGHALVDRLADALPDLPGAELVLHVDVADGWGETIGVEFFFDDFTATSAEWKGLFDHLVGAGVCPREPLDALACWCGDDEAGPALSAFARGGFRRVNHIKLNYSADGETRAKAYLYWGLVR